MNTGEVCIVTRRLGELLLDGVRRRAEIEDKLRGFLGVKPT